MQTFHIKRSRTSLVSCNQGRTFAKHDMAIAAIPAEGPLVEENQDTEFTIGMIMRIYAAADIHGKEARIVDLKRGIADEKPDILILAGDIFNYWISKHTIDLLKDLSVPIFGIRGNSDPKWIEKKMVSRTPVTLLGPTPKAFDRYELLGLNGTVVLPFLSKTAWFESQAITSLKQKIRHHTILVTHPPPRGVCDRVAKRFCAGSFGIKSLIESHPPMMILCGHIHEQSGFKYAGTTPVVNCAMNKNCYGAIIDCVKNRPVNIKMLKKQRK